MQIALKAIYWSILANVLLACIKGLVGYFGNSYAMIADAIESSSDVFSSLIVLLGIKISSRPRDENHPYGHGRIETLTSFIVVLFLAGSALLIGYESIQKIQTPHESPEPYTLLVLGAIILLKEILFRIEMKKAKESNSSSLKADAWHHRSDAITSLAAFVGISIAVLFGEGFEVADDWAALLASGFILYNSYIIFRPAFGELMDEHVHHELISSIRNSAEKVHGVLGTEKCFVRKTGMYFFVDLHVLVNGNLNVKEGHEIAHAVKDHVIAENASIADVLVHIEPN